MFKIGDKVKIIDCDSVSDYSSVIGKTGTIVYINEFYVYPYEIDFDEQELKDAVKSIKVGSLFAEDELELLEEYTLRKEVKEFAEEMEDKLKTKDAEHPNGWSEDTVEELAVKLDKRVTEMFREIFNTGNKEETHRLSVDIANFAMMVAYKTK